MRPTKPPTSSSARPKKAKNNDPAALLGEDKATRVSPQIAAERRQTLDILRPIVEMIGSVVGPNVELALHDLTKPGRSVVTIANGHVSGRKAGSSILSGPKDDRAFAAAWNALSDRKQQRYSIVADYPTSSPGGTPLKSATVIYRDSDGIPFAALCMNADLSMLKLAHAWLEHALAGKPRSVEPAEPAPEMDALMDEIIRSAIDTFGKPVKLMRKHEKVFAVEQMMRRGFFIVKGSVGSAATALGVSRFSIYNYLEEIRRREEGHAS